MTTARIVMTFHSKAVDDGTLLVATAEGVETLGQPFRFSLDLVSDRPQLDLAALLRADTRLTMNRTTVLADGRQVAFDYDYHGKLASIRQVGRAGARHYRYRAVLRAHLWQLSRSRRSRIYTDKTVPDLLRLVFDEAGIAYTFKLADEKAYPIHPYLVQYEETDLDFVTRWMEQVGICHYYDAQGDRGTLVLTDHAGGYAPLGVSQRVEYSDQPQPSWGSGEIPHIVRLELEDTPVPQRIQLKEYNYEAPGNELLFEAEVDPKGAGVWYEYNSNFRTEREGRFLATVRRDYWRGHARRLYGETDHRGFQCGRTFTPVRHFNHDVSDHDFVLIEVHHQLDQGDGSDAAASGSYSCTFTAMPAALPYRPERDTAWPSIHGVVHGRVAGGALGYAELDDMGRYKIDVDYDLNDQTIAKVRMAQPSVGENAGMHFPLRKHTEVLLGHIDGDPDKPVILGAVHDAEKTNLLDKALDPLGTKSSIKSQGGNLIEMNDEPGYKRLTLANGSFSMVQSFGRPECLHDPNDEASASEHAGGQRKSRAAARGVGRQADAPRMGLPADARTEASSAHHADALPANSLQVSASGGGSLQRPNAATLKGIVVKGSLVTGTTTTVWTKTSGPGTVTFGNAATLNTTAQFSADGTYILRLTASVKPTTGTTVTSFDEVTVVVSAADNSLQVEINGDDAVELPSTGSLKGIVVKGRDVIGAVTFAWTMVSGPGTATFSNPTSQDTSATFPAEGTYVLRLTVTSTTTAGTVVTTTDDMTVVVTPAPDAAAPTETNLPANFSAEGTSDNSVANSAMSKFWSSVAGKWTATGAYDAANGGVANWQTQALAEFKALYNTPAPVDCVNYGGHASDSAPTAASDFPDYMGSLSDSTNLTSVTVPGMPNVGTTDPDPSFANYAASAGGNQSITLGDAIDITHGNSWSYQEGKTVGYQKGDSHDFRLGGTSFGYNWSPKEVTWTKGASNSWSYSEDTNEWSYAKNTRSWSKCIKSESREQMDYSDSYTNVIHTQKSRTEAGSIESYTACGGSTTMSIGGPSFDLSLNVGKVAIDAAVKASISLGVMFEMSIAAKISGTLEGKFEFGTSKNEATAQENKFTALEGKVTALETSTSTMKAESVAAALKDVKALMKTSIVELNKGDAVLKSVGTSLKTGFNIIL